MPASTAVVITILETAQCQKITLALQKIYPFILMLADLLMAPNLLGSNVGLLLSRDESPRKGHTTSESLIRNLTLGTLIPVLLEGGFSTSPLAPDSQMVDLFLFPKRISAPLLWPMLKSLTLLCLLLENGNYNSIYK